MRVAIYARVSTKVQSTEAQIAELMEYAKFKKYEVVAIYDDRITGDFSKRKRRTRHDDLMSDAEEKKFDAVIVWKLDRFGRTFSNLIVSTERLANLKIEFISLKDAIDTSTTTGRFFFKMLAAIAELEREMIVERCEAGRKRAMELGVRFGPKDIGRMGRPRTPAEDIGKMVEMRQSGHKLREIAQTYNLSIPTVFTILRRGRY
jgi:DNA invertase Pin-like site-specific DNA recombinase